MSDGWIRTSRGTLVKRYGVPRVPVARGHYPTPMLIGDTIPETQSMTDGKYYTSKSAMRASYRADGNPQGMEYVELGNEKLPEPDRSTPPVDRNLIRKAAEDVRDGNIPEWIRNL